MSNAQLRLLQELSESELWLLVSSDNRADLDAFQTTWGFKTVDYHNVECAAQTTTNGRVFKSNNHSSGKLGFSYHPNWPVYEHTLAPSLTVHSIGSWTSLTHTTMSSSKTGPCFIYYLLIAFFICFTSWLQFLFCHLPFSPPASLLPTPSTPPLYLILSEVDQNLPCQASLLRIQQFYRERICLIQFYNKSWCFSFSPLTILYFHFTLSLVTSLHQPPSFFLLWPCLAFSTIKTFQVSPS